MSEQANNRPEDVKKLLSKNEMYVPFSVYEKTGMDPANFDANLSSLSKYENKVMDFLTGVSHDFHRTYVTAGTAKNGGSKPLAKPEIEERTKLRAITLIKTTGAANNSTRKGLLASEPRPRKRPRRVISDFSLDSSKPDFGSSLSFLSALNKKWVAYAQKLFGRSIPASDTRLSPSLLASLDSRLELIGSSIQVLSCPSMSSRTGLTGIIVGTTKNTWKIATVMASKSGKSKSKSSSELRVLSIPKRASELLLLIPLDAADASFPMVTEVLDKLTKGRRLIRINLHGGDEGT